MTPSNRIAQFIQETDYASLPEEVIHQFKKTLMDYMAATILGSTSPVSQKVFKYTKSYGSEGKCSVLGRTEKLAAQDAAFVNGTSAHCFEFDDGHRLGGVHPASVIYPAVLALAELHSLSAKQIVASSVIGYDIMIRVSMAMHPKSFFRGFHNTPNAGPFGSTGAAAKLLLLNQKETLNALGIAGSFAGGIRAYMQNGADIKRIHPGKAARDGIVCAELARHGLTGPPEVLEGKNGFFQSRAGEADLEILVNDLGSTYEIMNNYFKPYPACRHLHGPIDCVLRIKQQKGKLDPANITSIKIGAYKVASTFASKRFAELLETQTSIPCAVAAAVVYDQIGIQAFMPENFADSPILQQLIDKTLVYIEDECEERYPGTRSVKVFIEFSNGETVTEKVDFPRGSKEAPLNDTDIEEKFLLNCEPIIGQKNCQELIQRIWDFNNQKDLGFIFSGGLHRS